MATPGAGSIFPTSGHDTFLQIHSSLARTQRARPPPIDTRTEQDNRVPLRQELHKRASRFGLEGMFTRNKPDVRSSIITPVVEEPVSAPMSYEKSEEATESTSTANFTNPRPAPTPIHTTFVSSVALARSMSRPSRLNLISKSVKESKPSAKASPISNLRIGKTPTRTSAAWDPPPLFQAYPQAIKHATLSASSLSADVILRMSNHKRNNSSMDDMTTGSNGSGQTSTAAAKRIEKAKNKHKRQLSDCLSKAEWTRKIYVLVTSGYLLQYAADGSFDRLPEKMMQLGKDSVAFASDVIPGKHWVLQISQSMDADGTPTTDSQSLLSRLAFRGADYRRNATSFLLVLNSADDLDSWIVAVRREIEALGGKKNITETGKRKSEEAVVQLKPQPSHRFLVQKGSVDQFSTLSSPQSSSFGAPSWTNESLEPEKLADAVSAFSKAQTSPFNKSSESHCSMTTLSSHDGHQLDALRDSAHRLSCMSSGQQTYMTTESSSSSCSPARNSFSSAFDENTPAQSIEDGRARPNAMAINERRRSAQVLRNATQDLLSAPKFRPFSTYDAPSRTSRSKSPTPLSNVRRDSTMQHSFSKSPASANTSAKIVAPERLPPPTLVTTMPIRPRDSVLRGSRKAPPTALNLTRPLSPVKDLSSPKRPMSVRMTNPTETSLQSAPRSRDSLISTPSKSPRSRSSSSNAHRRIDFPLNSPDRLSVEFQNPQPKSLRDSQLPRFHREPTPPEALTTPLPPSPSTRPQTHPQSLALGSKPIARESQYSSINSSRTTPLRRAKSDQVDFNLPPTPPTSARAIKAPQRPTTPMSRPRTARPYRRSPVQRYHVRSSPKMHITNTRSMPTLLNGPPPAPPPQYALPPLPPPSNAGKGMVGSKTG